MVASSFYCWQRTHGYFVLPGGAGGPLVVSRVLVVEFDAQNRVIRTRIDDGSVLSAHDLVQADTTAPLTLDGERVEFGREARWTPNADYAAWSRRGGKIPEEVDGHLILTVRGVFFKKQGSWGTAPPDLSLPYDQIADVELKRAILNLGRWILIRTKDGTVHSLAVITHPSLAADGFKAPVRSETEEAFSLIKWQPTALPTR